MDNESKHLKFLRSILEKATNLYKERHYNIFWALASWGGK